MVFKIVPAQLTLNNYKHEPQIIKNKFKKEKPGPFARVLETTIKSISK